MSEDVHCVLCQHHIEARQTVVFQPDGQLVHVTCLASTEAPLTRLVPKPIPDPICAACSEPIAPIHSIIKCGTDLLHVGCFLERRDVSDGADPPARERRASMAE
jgi:hypothetical protein